VFPLYPKPVAAPGFRMKAGILLAIMNKELFWTLSGRLILPRFKTLWMQHEPFKIIHEPLQNRKTSPKRMVQTPISSTLEF